MVPHLVNDGIADEYLLSLNPKPSKFKVRTGCITCKTRRVKCDEAKPFCSRCTRFGTTCGGYPKLRATVPRRSLLPKSGDVVLQCPITSQMIRSEPLFESERDSQYFRVYCEETGDQISGPFLTGLWKRLIPQMSEAVPFIKHAVIAVAAMSKTSGDANYLLMMTGEGEEASRLQLEHQYALQQYQKALKGMRRAVELGKHDLQSSLIACLLTFSFESLLGRQGPACSLASSGVALFHEWMSNYNAGLATSASPNTYVIENDLFQAIAGLDIHVAFFLDTRPSSLHKRVIDDTAKGLLSMPSSFKSLCDARTYWQMIMRRNFHFRARAQIEGNAAELAAARASSGWDGSADFLSREVPFANVKRPTPATRAQCEEYISDIYRWVDAAGSWLDPLKQPDPARRVVCALLQIHVNMNIITLVSMSFTSESSFDELLPEFRAITNLSASIIDQLLDASKETAFYRYDLGILPALYLVGTRCRDRYVRGQAIDLMLSHQIREGVWDSLCIGYIADRIRLIEEEGGIPGEDRIPESRRVFITRVDADCDSYHRRCTIFYSQRKGPLDSDLVFNERLVTW